MFLFEVIYQPFFYFQKNLLQFFIFQMIVGSAYLYFFNSNNVASVDFCENNYNVSPNIKEFWNTISMFPWIISASYGYIQSVKKRYDDKIVTLHGLSLLIAVGSIIFHTYLTRITQSFDELPMLYLGFYILSLVTNMLFSKFSQNINICSDKIINKFVILGSIGITIMYYKNTDYFLFVLLYLVLTSLSVFCIIYKIFITKNKNNYLIGLYGVGNIIFATLLWFIEWYNCNQWLKLHALWHILISYGLYNTISFINLEIIRNEY